MLRVLHNYAAKRTADWDNMQINSAFCGDFTIYRRADDWHKGRSK